MRERPRDRLLIERLPQGKVVAVDASPSMIEKVAGCWARRGAGVADLTELELAEPVDAIFSNATFHWVLDHRRLFERLYAALAPAGGSRRSAAAMATWPSSNVRSRRSAATSASPRTCVASPAVELRRRRGDRGCGWSAAGLRGSALWLEQKPAQPREPRATWSRGPRRPPRPPAASTLHEAYVEARPRGRCPVR